MTEPSDQDPGLRAHPGTAALTKELADFLIELSIGVHRYAMYPPGHPSLGPAVQGVVRRLGPLLARRPSLNIGVARRQLVIEGVATDQKHPVLSEMARRLHELQLGAVTFEAGVGGDEIIQLLSTLAQDVDPDETPLGLLPVEQLPSWPHIRVHPLGYDRLTIKDSAGEEHRPDRPTQLWLGLAQAALGGEEVTPEQETDAGFIARSIREHRRDAAYDQVIVGYMLQLANELKSEKSAEAERVRKRMAGLVREMDEGTLARLVEMGGDYSARKRFVLDANQSLSVDAVVRILRAAASASGQTVSTSLTRLLSKLAVHADEGTGRLKTQAGTALRENVERLLEDWELDDPNPDAYTRLLDGIARAAPIFEARRDSAELTDDDELPGPLRLLETALEVDAYGTTVQAAVLDCITLGYAGTVLTLVKDLPEDHFAASEVLRELTHPHQVKRYLSRSDVEEDALASLADSLGSEAAIPIFLDALADSESRSVRRKVFDRLHQMGDRVGEEVRRRLQGEDRWYVIRNWLALLRFFPLSAREVDPLPYLKDGDPRVRREAIALALDRPELRDRGLALALADPDERNCRTALSQLPAPVPDTLVPSVVKRVLKARREPELKTLAIRSLQSNRTPLVRDALVELCTTGRSLLGKAKLTEPGPVMLAAVSALAWGWRVDPQVQPVLDQALKARSEEVRRAVLDAQEDTHG